MNDLLSSPFDEITESWKPAPGVSVNEHTAHAIREIYNRRSLTEAGIIRLANFLNEDREARHSWPGEDLFAFLRQIFDQGVIRASDIAQLQRTFDRIESHCASLPFTGDDSRIPMNATRKEELELPVLNGVEEISLQGRSFTVDLAKQKCSCREFQKVRRAHPVGHLKRCCRHLALAFQRRLEAGTLGEHAPVLKYVWADLALREEGIDHQLEWSLHKIKMRPYLIGRSQRSWATVYGPTADGRVGRFEYHTDEGRWAFGLAPITSGTVVDLLGAR